MAFFQMRDDAMKWFHDLYRDEKKEKPFEIKYDLYYLCLMLGISYQRTSDPTAHGRKSTGFIDHLPQSYKPTQRLVSGLLLRAELRGQGIEIDEKESVRELIDELIDPATGFSDYAVTQLNRYASGGFDLLVETLPDRPRTSPEFFRVYLELLEDAPA